MGGLAGHYEYCYSFWAGDDSIIPLYSWQLSIVSAEEMKTYLFDIRTNFGLKGNDGQITGLGWERFGSAVLNVGDDAFFCLEDYTKDRLQFDYGMSDDELRSWAVAALDFAKQTAAADSSSKRVIAVVVGLDVLTVQQEGEPMDAAIHRAIKTESLIPIYLRLDVPKGIMTNNMQQHGEKIFYSKFLMDLPRIRAQDEAAMALTCAVCSRNSPKGTQISPLPTCNHFVHPRCLFDWLRDLNSCCPFCSAPIPNDKLFQDDFQQSESTHPMSSLLITG